MLPEVRSWLTSMTNHKINQCLKAFCHRDTGIRLALIQCKEPQLALLLLILMDDVFNTELTFTLYRHCISLKCWNVTLSYITSDFRITCTSVLFFGVLRHTQDTYCPKNWFKSLSQVKRRLFSNHHKNFNMWPKMQFLHNVFSLLWTYQMDSHGMHVPSDLIFIHLMIKF